MDDDRGDAEEETPDNTTDDEDDEDDENDEKIHAHAANVDEVADDEPQEPDSEKKTRLKPTRKIPTNREKAEVSAPRCDK